MSSISQFQVKLNFNEAASVFLNLKPAKFMPLSISVICVPDATYRGKFLSDTQSND